MLSALAAYTLPHFLGANEKKEANVALSTLSYLNNL